MTYEKPELVLVDRADAIVLGTAIGVGDNAGTAPFELPPEGFALGLDE